MSEYSRVQQGWLTAAELSSYTGKEREPIFDVTNLRIVYMLGTGPGEYVAMASESYVDGKVASLQSGSGQILSLFNNCI